MSRNHDALLVLACFSPPNDMAQLVGDILSGHVFEDAKDTGNHPFPDCLYIHTSPLQEVVEEDGKVYFITQNTTYLYIGFAVGHAEAWQAYQSYVDTNRRGPVSLTGDPVI